MAIRRTLGYWLLNTARGIRARLGIQLASAVTIALSLLLLGLALVGRDNVERVTARWGRGVQVVVYLAPGASEEAVAGLQQTLRDRTEVSKVVWVSPRWARKRLADSLGSRGSVVEGVEPDFFPASLEVSLRQDRPRGVKALLSLLRSSPLVDEVDAMGRWARRLNALVALLNLLAAAVALVVGLACLYIVYSTIKLGVHDRREEIGIQRLVGATDVFVRAPFMIEGALQGGLGAGLAWALLYGLFVLGRSHLSQLLSSSFGAFELTFVPLSTVLWGVGFGALLGLVGSRLALGRYTGA